VAAPGTKLGMPKPAEKGDATPPLAAVTEPYDP